MPCHRVIAALAAALLISPAAAQDASIKEPVETSRKVEGASLAAANLRGRDLSNRSLRGADLRAADLRDANLSGADLTAADLRDARLEGANFAGAKGLERALTRGACYDKATRLPAGFDPRGLGSMEAADASAGALPLPGPMMPQGIRQ